MGVAAEMRYLTGEQSLNSGLRADSSSIPGLVGWAANARGMRLLKGRDSERVLPILAGLSPRPGVEVGQTDRLFSPQG